MLNSNAQCSMLNTQCCRHCNCANLVFPFFHRSCYTLTTFLLIILLSFVLSGSLYKNGGMTTSYEHIRKTQLICSCSPHTHSCHDPYRVLCARHCPRDHAQ